MSFLGLFLLVGFSHLLRVIFSCCFACKTIFRITFIKIDLREGERNIYLWLHLLMHSLIDSCMSPGRHWTGNFSVWGWCSNQGFPTSGQQTGTGLGLLGIGPHTRKLEYNELESSWNHPPAPTHTHHGLWKTCLPRNLSLVPKSLRTTALTNCATLLSAWWFLIECQALWILPFFFFLKILFIFREQKREGEREGEKHQCVVAFDVPPTGI